MQVLSLGKYRRQYPPLTNNLIFFIMKASYILLAIILVIYVFLVKHNIDKENAYQACLTHAITDSECETCDYLYK